MITTHEYIRKHLLNQIGLALRPVDRDDPELTLADIIKVYEEPLTKCAHRLLFGALRYGKYRDRRKGEHDYTPALVDRIKRYEATGNRDLLLDCINIAILEYVFEGHPNSHYDPVDEHDFHDHMKVKVKS